MPDMFRRLSRHHHQGLYLGLHIKSIRFVVGLNNISRTHYQENGPDRGEFTHPKKHSTQSTAHSHSTVKCNRSVTVTKSSPWRWPSRVETFRSVLQLMIKLCLCICWWLVFLYVTSVNNILVVYFVGMFCHKTYSRKMRQYFALRIK
jgi:hypothetical protein